MPSLRDKGPEVSNRPDLSPLTNPVLERNLSRWAQVYFSNPPGKREQAISQLLQEIRKETVESLKAGAARESVVPSAELLEIECSTCLRRNPPGNKFCGRCGEPLDPAPSTSTNQSNVASTGIAAASPPAQSDTDVDWLRDRSLGSLQASDAPPSHKWKYLAGVVAIVLAGLVYMQWAPRLKTGVASSTKAAAPASPANPLEVSDRASSTAAPEAIRPDSKSPDLRRGLAAGEAHDLQTASRGVQPASRKSSMLAAPRSPQSAAGSGDPDLRLAERYLSGGMGARDSSEAAKLLWKAVGKENPTAAVLLSDLYLRGDGVPKSCDQARLLLVAAAKRGASQAAEQLRGLESHGCS